ncbi:HAD hydrolase-like protein, partial [bacterium]|nr:HAD hydrolase-like protein [bacterium]
PEETWCVGDNVDWDIRGAQACGITAVWKDGRSGAPAGQNGSMEEIRPDAVITEFSRLIGLWEQAGSGASRPVKAKTRSRR